MKFNSLRNTTKLIDGVVLHPLKRYEDKRGYLTELIRNDWKEVIEKTGPIVQVYYSVTHPGYARDEQQWHYHPNKQVDRFAVIKGSAVFALFDWRKESKTYGSLNLFFMETGKKERNFLLSIPKNILHTFTTVGREECFLIGFPSTIYDPKEEGRFSFAKANISLEDGTPFAWDIIREAVKL